MGAGKMENATFGVSQMIARFGRGIISADKMNKAWVGLGIGAAVAVALILRGLNVLAPKGIRNNNPGNLRPLPSGKWDGQSVVDSANLCVFYTAVMGIRAAARNLSNYTKKYGVNSIRGMANKWAPASENNPDEYADIVSKVSGIAKDAFIDLSNKETNLKVLKGIIRAENGYKVPGVEWFTDAEISAGQTLAGLK